MPEHGSALDWIGTLGTSVLDVLPVPSRYAERAEAGMTPVTAAPAELGVTS